MLWEMQSTANYEVIQMLKAEGLSPIEISRALHMCELEVEQAEGIFPFASGHKSSHSLWDWISFN